MRPRVSNPILCSLALFLLGALSTPLHGQVIRGYVVEQGGLTPVAGAVVTLMTEELEPRGSAVAADGSFSFTVAAGRYLLQASLGNQYSDLSAVVEVGEATTREVVLSLPSPLIALVETCGEEERRAGTGVLVGILYDGQAEVALPGAEVTLTWEEGGVGRGQARSTTDAAGRYLFCAVPVGIPIRAQTRMLGRSGIESQFVLPAAPLARWDLALELPTTTLAVERRTRQGGPTLLSTLAGRLVDVETGQPISGAVVSLADTRLSQVTDAEGLFRFAGLSPRTYSLRVQHLGYGTQSRAVELPSGSDLTVELRLAARAVEVEGITVVARSELEQARRSSPTRLNAISGEELRQLELQGARVGDVLRSRVPGLTVIEGDFDTPDGRSPICIQTNRRIMSLTPRGGGARPFCDMVVVYIDDVRITAPGDVLRNLQLADFETVQFLNPLDAGVRYGLDAASGVLLLYTRGRGPFVQQPRGS